MAHPRRRREGAVSRNRYGSRYEGGGRLRRAGRGRQENNFAEGGLKRVGGALTLGVTAPWTRNYGVQPAHARSDLGNT